jgi:uncharacterized protein (DUF849 family)
MTDEEFVLFVVKQQKLTRNVVTCDEAGAFGFHLHRRFEEPGIQPVVLHPFATPLDNLMSSITLDRSMC